MGNLPGFTEQGGFCQFCSVACGRGGEGAVGSTSRAGPGGRKPVLAAFRRRTGRRRGQKWQNGRFPRKTAGFWPKPSFFGTQNRRFSGEKRCFSPESRRFFPGSRRFFPGSRRFFPGSRRPFPEPRCSFRGLRRFFPESRRFFPEIRRPFPGSRGFFPEPRRSFPKAQRPQPNGKRQNHGRTESYLAESLVSKCGASPVRVPPAMILSSLRMILSCHDSVGLLRSHKESLRKGVIWMESSNGNRAGGPRRSGGGVAERLLAAGRLHPERLGRGPGQNRERECRGAGGAGAGGDDADVEPGVVGG
jgi:hypothetical protein